MSNTKLNDDGLWKEIVEILYGKRDGAYTVNMRKVDDLLALISRQKEEAVLSELEMILEAGHGQDFIGDMAGAVGEVGRRYQELKSTSEGEQGK